MIEGFKENLRNPHKMPLPCQAFFVSCLIDPYGGVVPCITLTDKIIGNLRDTSYDLLPLWESDKAAGRRKVIKDGNCAVCWTDCQAFENLLYQKGDFMDHVSFDGVIEKIKTILARNSGVENMRIDTIHNDTQVFGLGGVITDSLNILDALTEIESEFAFEIPDEDLTEELFVSVETLAQYVYKNGVCKGG